MGVFRAADAGKHTIGTNLICTPSEDENECWNMIISNSLKSQEHRDEPNSLERCQSFLYICQYN